MWKVERPAINATQLYQTCVAGVRNQDLRARLQLIEPLIGEACEDYEFSANAGLLHTIPVSTVVGNVTRQELKGVYGNGMVRGSSPGRPTYDAIMSTPRSGRCPLCGHRRVSTLDHHLPQALYPAFSVAPLNLVPACRDCNTAKLTLVAATAEESTLHPYFDDVEASRWLLAELREQVPPTVRFRPQPPQNWPAVLAARVRNHFATFKLGTLYASEAADELRAIQSTLTKLLAAGGPAAVRDFLAEAAESCQQVFPNWWRTAAYEALQASPWFCEGGFLGAVVN
jgi:hypothetical protein